MSIAELPATNKPETWSDDGPLYEIIDGTYVELPMSAENVFLANQLSHQIAAFARPKNLGRSVVEILFDLSLADRSRNRRPDAAFVSYERWPRTRPLPPVGNAWAVVPDLAVEFVSPSETADELHEKLRDYLGCRREVCVDRLYAASVRARI